MADIFYSLAQAATALGTTAEHIRQLVAEGRVREFRDGATQLFKISEIEALKGKIEPHAPGTPTSEPPRGPSAEPYGIGDEPLDLGPDGDQDAVKGLAELLGLSEEDASARIGAWDLQPADVEAADASTWQSRSEADLVSEATTASPGGLDVVSGPAKSQGRGVGGRGATARAATPAVRTEPIRPIVRPGRAGHRLSLWRRFWKGFRNDQIGAVFLVGVALVVFWLACALGILLLLRRL